MKKNIKKIIIFILILIIILIGSYFILSLGNDRDKITNIIEKKYNTYEIVDIKLEYVNFFSTVSDAEEDGHKATQAEVIIKNEIDQMTIRFDKIFNIWKISSEEYDYGPNVPNDIYFIEEDYHNVGKAIDIEKSMENNWVVPDENGNKYTKVGDDESWYYSYKVYTNIYKTKSGYVYVYNKENRDWDKTNKKYSEMTYYSNYEKIDKEEAQRILKNYSSYIEE